MQALALPFKKSHAGFCLLIVLLLSPAIELKSQVIDDFSGQFVLTNNGISPIPTFSLGEPAFSINLRMARRRFSFEPEFNFEFLQGMPWAFALPFRYYAVKTETFNLILGVEPSVNFQSLEALADGKTRRVIESRRYFGFQVAPTFTVTRNWFVSFFYLRGFGFDDGPKRAHFLSFSTSVNRLRVSRYFYLTFRPQVFHLRVDDEEGYYTSMYTELNFGDSPFSLSTTFNKSLDTEISPEQDFIWNAALIYTFKGL